MLLEEKTEKKKKGSLLVKIADGDSESVTPKMLYNAARMGDGLSLEIVERISKINAVGFGNIINAFDPSLIALGGAIALENTDMIIKPIKRLVGDHAINTVPNITITPLGEDVILYGAIAMAFKPPF
jgi:glucokinase